MFKMNKEPARIFDIKEEGEDIATFFFDKCVSTTPGRFMGIWIPEYGEKPFSISHEGCLGITAKRIETDPKDPMKGKFTNRLFEMRKGDYVWLTGPKGKGFPVRSFNRSRKVCLVGGGTGIAPLAFLSDRIYGANVISFIGAKTQKEMIMENRFKKPHISTDDGSYYEKGFVTDLLERYDLESLRGPETMAAICGPEKMMSKAARILEKYIPPKNIYVSVERLMKCYDGLCGSCDFGGYRVCKDGSVFTYEEIKDVPDFGKFKRDRCGRKELL